MERAGAGAMVEAVVEIPKGSRNKYERGPCVPRVIENGPDVQTPGHPP